MTGRPPGQSPDGLTIGAPIIARPSGTAGPWVAAPYAPLATAEPDHSRIRTIVKHLSLNLLIANLVPGALFYSCMRLGSVWIALIALIAALAWRYGVLIWRISTKRRTSGLVLLTAVGLTAKTVLRVCQRQHLLYFLQPAANDAVRLVVPRLGDRRQRRSALCEAITHRVHTVGRRGDRGRLPRIDKAEHHRLVS